jgi:hypothetical protein
MSQLYYNSIEIGMVHTQSIDQEAVYDESRTDLLHIKTTVRIEGVLASNVMPGAPGESPTQIKTRIETALMTPRQTLKFMVAGETLLESPVPGKTTDLANGPKPLYCNITAIHGTGTFLISYAVETAILNCANAASIVWLANRWQESQSIDSRMYSKFVRTGRLTARSDLLSAEGIDSLRGLVIPPIRDG